jgi:hypothetical protein
VDSRRDDTWALVAVVSDGNAVMVLSEWHPGRAVPVAQRLLPVGVGEPGSWLRLTADLSKPTAVGLQVAPIAVARRPAELPEVRWRPPPKRDRRAKPRCRLDCGDIVLEQVQALHQRTFFVRARPAELEPGGRVYPAYDGEVVGFLILESWRISPNGLRLACRPQMHRVEQPSRRRTWCVGRNVRIANWTTPKAIHVARTRTTHCSCTL